MKIKDILRNKGSQVITGTVDMTLYEAVQTMVSNRVGALVVVDDDDCPIGIFTERDLLRQVAEGIENVNNNKLGDVMTMELIVGVSEDDTEACLSLMTEKRMRHLPIIDNGKLVGLISIGDIVKTGHAEAKFEIHYMRDYIMGKI